MHAYKYLSITKTREIEAALPRRRVVSLRGDLAIPGIGQISIETRPAGIDLDRVIGHVSTDANWYEEGDFQAGGWVEFDVPLVHTCREIKRKSVALFIDRPGAGRRRLLLHGSVDSLVGVHTAATVDQTPHDPEASSSRIIPVLMRNPTSAPVNSNDEVTALFRRLDFALDPATAIQMRGFAQVTMNSFGRMPLIASPLYIACPIGSD